MVNSQVHEHTPYELVFGQPPRSVLLLDVAIRGKIDEEDLKDETCIAKQRIPENETNVDEIVNEKNNEDDYSRKDHDVYYDTGSMGDDGSQEEHHGDGGSKLRMTIKKVAAWKMITEWRRITMMVEAWKMVAGMKTIKVVAACKMMSMKIMTLQSARRIMDNEDRGSLENGGGKEDYKDDGSILVYRMVLLLVNNAHH